MRAAIVKVIGVSIVVSSLALAAERDRPVRKTLIEIVRAIEKTSYKPITDISLDDGKWEVETYRNGLAYELLIDPITGRIVAEHRDDGDPTPPADAKPLSEIIQILETKGYTRIDEISFERRYWEVEAVRDRTDRELRVDPIAGKVISDRVDD